MGLAWFGRVCLVEVSPLGVMDALVLQTMLVSTNQLAVSWPARVGSRFKLGADNGR